MTLGIGTYALRWSIGFGDRIPPRPMSALQVIETAVQLGVGLVQFADNLPLHRLTDGTIADLAALARHHGVELEVGMTGCAPDLIKRYLGIAEVVGAKLLRVAPTAAEAALPDAALARMLSASLGECRRAGVSLAVENHFHLPSPRLVRIIETIGDPLVGVCLDVANSIACQEWPKDTIALLAPYALNLHLKDYRIAIDPHGVGCAFTGMPLGQGLLDIDHVLATLRKNRRSVNIILEYWLPWQGTFDDTLRLEMAWLQQSIAAARARTGEKQPNELEGD